MRAGNHGTREMSFMQQLSKVVLHHPQVIRNVANQLARMLLSAMRAKSLGRILLPVLVLKPLFCLERLSAGRFLAVGGNSDSLSFFTGAACVWTTRAAACNSASLGCFRAAATAPFASGLMTVFALCSCPAMLTTCFAILFSASWYTCCCVLSATDAKSLSRDSGPTLSRYERNASQPVCRTSPKSLYTLLTNH